MIEPIAFSIFGMDIYWYGIVYSLGFIFSYNFILYNLKHLNSKSNKQNKYLILTENTFSNISLIIVISCLIGARLFHILFYNFSYYYNNPIKIFYYWEGGMAIHGILPIFLILTYYFSKKYKFSFFKLTDLFAIAGFFCFSIGRIANFINQELVGTITTSKIGVVFPLYDNNIRWPTQLFESIKNMIGFQISLYLYYIKNVKPGIITSLFLIIYNFGRFFIDFLRIHENSVGIFSMGQFLCLIFGFLGIIMIFYIIYEQKIKLLFYNKFNYNNKKLFKHN